MPSIKIPRKLQKTLTAKQRFIVLIGGRGSGKSRGTANILTHKCQVEGADVLCGREFQNSIEDSVHKVVKSVIEESGATNFTITDRKIDHKPRGGFRFKGFARSPESVKSAEGFKYFWAEEAQTLSDDSIRQITPTIREEGSQLWFTANPQSSEDPFSRRFIVPYKSFLDRDGYYEDDLHLIIVMNWRDNPWFPEELEAERQHDFKHLSRAEYDHIWEGEFNDSIENALVYAEWFDACVDSHLGLGINPSGARFSSHDPSDTGPDSKGYCFRHGSVVLDVDEMVWGNVNEGCDWALDKAIKNKSDWFTWDCDGLGAALARQVEHALQGKHCKIAMFKGSEKVDFPDSVFNPVSNIALQGQKKNKDALANKRAQYYLKLRERVFKTYQAVVEKKMCNPDDLISFSSGITNLTKLRSELCRIPIKPNSNGKFELYTKVEMKSKFKIASPNLADSVMMSERSPFNPTVIRNIKRPPVTKPISFGSYKKKYCR